MRNIIFYSLFISLCSNETFGQEYSYLNYTPRNGLAGSNAYSLMQDADGYIWICTENGISRFDGTNFKTLNTQNGLVESETFFSYQDTRKKRIWFSTFSNAKSYFLNDSIYTIKNDIKLNNTYNFSFLNLYEDYKGSLWFLGFHVVKYNEKTWKKYEIPKGEFFTDAYTDLNNTICFIGVAGIYKLENEALVLSQPFTPYNECKFHLKRGNIIFSFNKNMVNSYRIDADSLRWIHSSSIPYLISRLKIDRFDNLWLCTAGNGAYKVDWMTGDTVVYMKNRTVTDVLIDKENNTWFSTFGDGVFMLSYPYVSLCSRESGLSSSNVCSVSGDEEGNIWVGFKNGKINCITPNGIRRINTTILEGYNRVLNFAFTEEGDMVCATDLGAFRVKKSTTEALFMGEITSAAKCVLISKQGYFFLATARCGFSVSPFKKYTKSICNQRFTSVLQTYDNTVLWGNQNGLYVFRKDSLQKFNSRIPEINTRITFMALAKDSGIWIATGNKGVVYLHEKKGICHSFRMVNGLISDNCKHVFVDANNAAWVSTSSGLSRIEYLPETNEQFISNYTSEDGLPIDEINQTYVRNDTVWVATVRGLACMNVHTRKQYMAPSVYITSCVTPAATYLKPAQLELKYWESRLQIKLSGLSFSAAGNLSYKYKLNGIDLDWNLTKSNEINYASLVPGTYFFQVYAVHPKGLLSRKPAILSFTILKPFWKTAWFFISVSVSLIVLFLLVYRSRLRKIQFQSEIKNALLTSEIKALRSQINPHFIFNSLNSIQDFIFKSRKEDANEYLAEFSKLIRMILENSLHNFVSIEDEIRFLNSYLKLEKLRMHERLSYSMEVQNDMLPEQVMIPSMLLQPFVENAILHGIYPKKTGGHLKIAFKCTSSTLTITIEDTGIGYDVSRQKTKIFNPDQPHTSTGIKNTSERIAALNKIHNFNIYFTIQTMTDPEGKSSGTCIEIFLPKIHF